MHTDQPIPTPRQGGAAIAALGADIGAFCAARLAHVAGTHGLFLDGLGMPVPQVPGVARWTRLACSTAVDGVWQGPLQGRLDALPFADDAFCAVLAGFDASVDVTVAEELARVLAAHGTLLVAGLHARSLWRGGVRPGRWERALRAAGLDVRPAVRCGTPWPSARGAADLPEWLVRAAGGAWVIEARRSVLATLPLRAAAGRLAMEHATLLPGAHRQCA